MKTTLKTRWPVLLLIVPGVIGLSMFTRDASISALLPGKGLWDWMELLLIPLVLAGGVVVWMKSQREAELQRAALQRDISADNHPETA